MVERFGVEVAELVDGVSKLDKLRFSSNEIAQAESFRKMLLAMSRDVRVIFVKLADRLHNLRTLGVMRPEKNVAELQRKHLKFTCRSRTGWAQHRFPRTAGTVFLQSLSPSLRYSARKRDSYAWEP